MPERDRRLVAAPPVYFCAEQAQWLPADGVTRTRLGDPLPFSLSPDAPLGARDVMAIMRDLCVPRARARARSLSL